MRKFEDKNFFGTGFGDGDILFAAFFVL